MQRIAVIGSGPTGVYVAHHLLKSRTPLSVTIYERHEKLGVGMPYSEHFSERMMLANIASIEIPPIGRTYMEWLKAQRRTKLKRYDVDEDALDDRQFLPRVLLGEYFHDQFLQLLEEGRERGHKVEVYTQCDLVDLELQDARVALWAGDGATMSKVFVDNYAAVPSESTRWLLALRDAGVVYLLELGDDYKRNLNEHKTVIVVGQDTREYDVFIDARGQKPLEIQDLPFSRLRNQLEKHIDHTLPVDGAFRLSLPHWPNSHISIAAIPYLMHDRPFVQGVTASAKIGKTVAVTIVDSIDWRHDNV